MNIFFFFFKLTCMRWVHKASRIKLYLHKKEKKMNNERNINFLLNALLGNQQTYFRKIFIS